MLFCHLYIAVIDAMGKPTSGLLEGHLTWLGSYDECIQIQATVNDTEPIKGKYCSAVFGQQQVTIELTFWALMDSSFWFDTINLGQSIDNIKGSLSSFFIY